MGNRSPIEEALGLFADVKAGEGVQVLLMLVNIFLILASYYILKTLREQLLTGGFFGLSGAQSKALGSAVMAGILIFVVPAYAWVSSRVSRLRLLNLSLVFVFIGLFAFFVLGKLFEVRIGAAYFLWLGIVNVFLIAQFWSYANDLYDQKQGKRLFALIAVGGSAGALAGPPIAGALAAYQYILLLVAGLVLLASLILYNVVERIAKKKAAEESRDEGEPLGSDGAFGLVLKSKYLLLMALLIGLTNLVNTTGEYILFATAESVAEAEIPNVEALGALEEGVDPEKALGKARGKIVGEFFGSFYFWMNLVSLLIQAFLVSRILKFIGVRGALLVLPLIALGGYLAIGLLGGVLLIRIAKTAENSTDYSLQNTVRQALFLPTSREEKYKAKAAIDTFFVRGGDAIAAMVVLGLSIGLGLGLQGFAFILAGISCITLTVAYLVAREHKKIAEE